MAFLSSLVTTVFVVLINTVVLTYLSQKFNLGDRSFFTALVVTSILGIFSFLLNFMNPVISVIITVPLGFYLIMWKYRIEWRLALKVWSLWFVISLAALFIVGAVAGFVSLLF